MCLLALSCFALGEGWCGLSQAIPFTLSSVSNLIFFFFFTFVPVVCWKFFFANLNFLEGSPICVLLSRIVFSQELLDCGWEGWELVHRTLPVLYAYYLMHRWVTLSQGPLVYDAVSHSSHKDTIVWMGAELFLLWGRTKSRNVLFHKDAITPCLYFWDAFCI